MTFFEALFFRLGVGNYKFNSDIWKKLPRKRSLFVKDIIENQVAVGMTKEQLIRFFGEDKNEYVDGVWSYVVSTDRGGKIKGSLYFYFDKDNIVSKISYADS